MMAAPSRAFGAVLFDLDDTLLDGDAAWDVGISCLLRRCPEADPAKARAAWSEANEEFFPRYLAGEFTFDEHRVARMRAWSQALDVTIPDGEEMEWFGSYRSGYESGWCTFADVAPCLAALGGLKAGIITNGDSAQQHRKVEALGLTRAFGAVVASGDIGIAKPDARIFAHTAELLGVAPEQCAYVGDKRDTDAQAATAAGMTGIWLDRRDQRAADDGVPRITTLAELPALLGLRGPAAEEAAG